MIDYELCDILSTKKSPKGSALNLMVISLDRFETIVHPLRRKIDGPKARLIIVGIWMLSLLGALTPFFDAKSSKEILSGMLPSRGLGSRNGSSTRFVSFHLIYSVNRGENMIC